MYRFILFCKAITFLIIPNIFSQDPPIEWEEIPLADLQMTAFSDDSNASAVILCDFGESKLNDDIEIIHNRHLRIKILNENGYKWGTHSIYLYTGKNGELLDDLEAITYSLNENGEIVETELDDDDIFKEEVTDKRVKYTFTMPALKPGCIVDIKYKITAESLWFIRDWTFQKDEPVLWSEYRLIYPKNISFAIVNLGYEPWAINDYKEVNQIFRGAAAAHLGNMVSCHYYRMVVKNAPALRDEPYITTIADYANRVDIQLAGYTFLRTGTQRVLTDWKTLVNELLDHKYFGNKIDPGDVEELTESIIKDIHSPEEKMKVIYDWITSSIVWSGKERMFAEYDVDDVIEYKKGNSADITFLLISMLKSAGLIADPVILSTRSNGLVQDLYPIISQFDYILARVTIGTKTFFIDATDPLRPIDLLPVKVLNVKCLVIKEDNPEWVFLASQKGNFDKTLINIILNADGTLSANIEEQFGEYKSLSLRRDINGKSDIDFAKEIFEAESSGFIIDSVTTIGKDSINLPLRIQAGISSTNYSQQGGDFIYFNPNMIHRLTDNPFKSKERKFPIDYAYPRGQITITNLTIPPGYELKEKYENKIINLGNSASFRRVMELNGNIIQIMSKMEIKESEIKPTYYKQLKEFYARVIASYSEMLVFGIIEKQDEVKGADK
jgi:hypothetical protein